MRKRAMRNQPCIWVTLVLAVCTCTASAQEEERIAQAFERLGAVVKRDDTKPNKPVIGLRFGLRNPIPDTTPEIIKDYILDIVGVFLRKDGSQKDAAKPPDPTILKVIKVTDADLNEVSKLENLETLDLSFGVITNLALEHIKGLKKLQTLDLRNTQVDDAGLAMVEELPSLKHLYLTNCPITDEGLVHLQKLNLESLYVGGMFTEITDKGMRNLKGLKSLQSLYLQYAHGVTDKGLNELKELTNLRELRLFNTGIRGEGLQHLSGLKELRTLDLGGNHLADDTLKHLAELKRLEVLYLSSDKLTDEGLKHLSGLKDLETLDLRGRGVTDEGMKTLQKLENLRQLGLAYTNVTDKGLKQLKGLKKLERLDLSEILVIGNGQMEIKQALPKLEIGPIPQFPDWYNIYTDQQRQQMPQGGPWKVPSLPKELTQRFKESEQSAPAKNPEAERVVAIGLLIAVSFGVCVAVIGLIWMAFVMFRETGEGNIAQRVFITVGKLFGMMVAGAVVLLIVGALYFVRRFMFGH
jgi:Leucine-rich repeat (LRR) protein